MLPLLLALAAGDTAGYWQQQVAYRITASLDEPSGVLTGRERITYVNRSADTLRDFFVHQYLNAFRPGSRWAAADSTEQRQRFQHLKDPDYAFERITEAAVMGRPLAPDYPYAPDSTIAHWTLPRALAPGDSMVVELAWQARPSTLPRRQGRAGRRFDFAQWYPKVVVYDRSGWEDHPLYPAGEFYGEFATYDVTLDVAQDQVIGATGVPVEGDPGWEGAKADTALRIDYQRDWYGNAERGTRKSEQPFRVPGSDFRVGCGAVPAGRKCVRFYAEQVHHFAFSLNPDFVYEQGRWGDVAVRVLYQRRNAAQWGNGVAVARTVAALAWLDSLYGKFAWPQLTNLDRIERGGGTEFPMVIMNDSPDLGLIVHETGHQYTMGILANNEWREAFLDEGFSNFQEAWFFERHGDPTSFAASEATVLALDLERWSEPVSTVSERFRDFFTYNRMVYTKGQLFYRQLRYVVGDSTMRRVLRVYYDRWKLKHVDEGAFRDVAEEVSGQDLEWLFAQWLHATVLIDYRLRRVERRRLPDGRWRTVVTIAKQGDGRMPVEIGDRDTIYARASGEAEIERVEFTSARKPGRLMLDPRVLSHDYDMLNNEERGLRWAFRKSRSNTTRLDDPFAETARRDARVSAFLPVVWSSDAGGVTVGLRGRSNYLRSYERGLLLWSVATRDSAPHRIGFYARWSNPIRHAPPRTATSLAGWSVEGRAGAALSVDRSLRRHLGFGADPHAGFDVVWMATTDLAYLDRRLWDVAGTVEGGPWVATRVPLGDGGAVLSARLGARAGALYWNPGRGVVSNSRYDFEGFARITGEASVRAPFALGTTLGVRLYGGAYGGASPPPRQRRIPVAGADPYETFTNPLLRSQGALLVRPDFHYHAPGGPNLRGFRSDLGGRWALAANLEVARSLLNRPEGILRAVTVEGFVDAGLVDTLAVRSSSPGRRYATLYDGGVGLVTRQQVRELGWTMRFEVPLAVNRWDLAADHGPGDGRFAFRWLVSLSPSF